MGLTFEDSYKMIIKGIWFKTILYLILGLKIKELKLVRMVEYSSTLTLKNCQIHFNNINELFIKIIALQLSYKTRTKKKSPQKKKKSTKIAKVFHCQTKFSCEPILKSSLWCLRSEAEIILNNFEYFLRFGLF